MILGKLKTMTKPINKIKKYAKERILEITKPHAYNSGQQDGRIWEITHLVDKCIEVLDE